MVFIRGEQKRETIPYYFISYSRKQVDIVEEKNGAIGILHTTAALPSAK